MTDAPRGVAGSRAAHRAAFETSLSFGLDDFQVDAINALDAGSNVLVSAPTGAGKTMIASYGILCAFDAGRKAFYTTPLKALSNQKFTELVADHGADQVGLLTGDVAIRPHAPIVVMTTEVLRNMLLTGSPLLDSLGLVVLDEVHFIQDPYRGGVWEEVLILTPPEVQFVCLSATVANASVLGAWIRSVRGPTEVIVERQRPITLRHHMAITPRGESGPILIDLLKGDRVADEGLRIDQANRRMDRPRTGPTTWRGSRPSGPPRPHGSPRRTDLIELLESRDMLPAISFIFSRAGCDDAVRQVVRDGIRLTSRSERQRIRTIAEHFVEEFDDEELTALGYDEWVEGLEVGVAGHHAGLIPAFREAVEVCFSQGLLQVVFATETLSLGINMPARTVILERFSKYGGAGRATLTSGEYAQMTGRAGRRGLDEEGHAVVGFSNEITIAEIARVAVAPPPDLHSSFRPTYNLACNLVKHFDREEAKGVLAKSYAQYEVDHHNRGTGRWSVAEVFGRRMAVLEEMGYVKGWSLTDAGERLRGLYHEADLLLAEIVGSHLLEGVEPAIAAGVLSSLIFEPRRARHSPGHAGTKKTKKRGALADRLGQGRVREIKALVEQVGVLSERLHGIEEVHLVPRSRKAEPGLATAVASWARGASLTTVLSVASRDIGQIAPGDFVRVIKQVADLAEQVGHISGEQELRQAMADLGPALLRSVVSAGVPVGSASLR